MSKAKTNLILFLKFFTMILGTSWFQ